MTVDQTDRMFLSIIFANPEFAAFVIGGGDGWCMNLTAVLVDISAAARGVYAGFVLDLLIQNLSADDVQPQAAIGHLYFAIFRHALFSLFT